MGQICPTICPTDFGKIFRLHKAKRFAAEAARMRMKAAEPVTFFSCALLGKNFFLPQDFKLFPYPAGRIRIFCTQKSLAGWLFIAVYFPAVRSCSIFGNFIEFYRLCYVLPVYAHGALCTDAFSSTRADLMRGTPFHQGTHREFTWPKQSAIPSVLKKDMGCHLCPARQY